MLRITLSGPQHSGKSAVAALLNAVLPLLRTVGKFKIIEKQEDADGE